MQSNMEVPVTIGFSRSKLTSGDHIKITVTTAILECLVSSNRKIVRVFVPSSLPIDSSSVLTASFLGDNIHIYVPTYNNGSVVIVRNPYAATDLNIEVETIMDNTGVVVKITKKDDSVFSELGALGAYSISLGVDIVMS